MWTLHPLCIHILHWSLKGSVKRTWTGSDFSTNESAWSAMVTGSQSHVWSGPKLRYILYIPLKWMVVFLKSWASTNYVWKSIGSSVTVMFCLISVGYYLELRVALAFLSRVSFFYPNNISSLYSHQRIWYKVVGKELYSQ